MKSELKKEYALRISQANNVEMIIVSYEIILTYLEDALSSKQDSLEYDTNIGCAYRVIEEMIANLHYEYELSKSLKQLYLYMKKRLRDARYCRDTEAIKEIIDKVNLLHDSYVKIKDKDNSEPLMKNTQAVLAGMTYGKNRILDELSNDCVSRGYRV